MPSTSLYPVIYSTSRRNLCFLDRPSFEADFFSGTLKISLGTHTTVIDGEGIAFSPMRELHLSEDVRLDYLVAARGA